MFGNNFTMITTRSSLSQALDYVPSVDLVTAINQVDDGFFQLDWLWRVRFVNQAAARMVGREIDDLMGKDIWVEFPAAVGSRFDRHYREALDTQTRVGFVEYFERLGAWLSIQIYPSPAGVTLVMRDVTEVHRLMAERRGLLDRLLAAEDRERARIAADVHDDSVQALGVVCLQLQLLRHHMVAPTPAVQAILDRLSEQVGLATDRLRSLLFRLEPTNADVPISTSIRVQAAHIFDGSGTHWSVDDLDAGAELPGAERSQALRIVKEALSNVRAHAAAHEVVITLQGTEDGLEIVVSDNGVATDPEAFLSAAGHRGLATMRDRAAGVGGRCTFEPSSPTGCTVRIYIPRVRSC